jgi:hypothetical protein
MTISSDVEEDQHQTNLRGVAIEPGPEFAKVGNPTEDDIVRIGQDAWSRLKQSRTLADWIAVGRAHVIGRTEAMRNAHTNAPLGRAYNVEFGRWIKHFGFDTLDKGDRSRLFDLMDNLPAIESWLAILTQTERLRLNHPTTIVKKWRATQAPKDTPDEPKASPFAQLKEANIGLQEQLHRAQEEIKRGGGDLWNKDDRPEDIATIMLSKLSRAKAERVARAMLVAIKNATKSKAPAAADAQPQPAAGAGGTT